MCDRSKKQNVSDFIHIRLIKNILICVSRDAQGLNMDQIGMDIPIVVTLFATVLRYLHSNLVIFSPPLPTLCQEI